MVESNYIFLKLKIMTLLSSKYKWCHRKKNNSNSWGLRMDKKDFKSQKLNLCRMNGPKIFFLKSQITSHRIFQLSSTADLAWVRLNAEWAVLPCSQFLWPYLKELKRNAFGNFEAYPFTKWKFIFWDIKYFGAHFFCYFRVMPPLSWLWSSENKKRPNANIQIII